MKPGQIQFKRVLGRGHPYLVRNTRRREISVVAIVKPGEFIQETKSAIPPKLLSRLLTRPRIGRVAGNYELVEDLDGVGETFAALGPPKGLEGAIITTRDKFRKGDLDFGDLMELPIKSGVLPSGWERDGDFAVGLPKVCAMVVANWDNQDFRVTVLDDTDKSVVVAAWREYLAAHQEEHDGPLGRLPGAERIKLLTPTDTIKTWLSREATCLVMEVHSCDIEAAHSAIERAMQQVVVDYSQGGYDVFPGRYKVISKSLREGEPRLRITLDVNRMIVIADLESEERLSAEELLEMFPSLATG